MDWRTVIRNEARFILLAVEEEANDKKLALLTDSTADLLKNYALKLYAQQTREPIKVIDPHVA